MSIRSTYGLGFLIICVILGTSFYLQLVSGVLPCPLCTLQRFSFILLGVLLLVGFIFNAHRFGRLIINLLAALVSLAGCILAGRQVWLQHSPNANAGECGVSLDYMLKVLPLNEVMQKVFTGSAECTQRGWEFLKLTMAEWSLLWFAIFFIVLLYALMREFNSR